jgi:hypothetical protein
MTYQLKSVAASEQLITDLYIDLRRKVRAWAAVTKQTAQARMGYVGQHLVSVVSGHPGGKSGARGRDLILPGGKFGEIKTCYRVDQLGKCADCGVAVASIEDACATCNSTNITRGDDSKWLIGIRNDNELDEILDPAIYYLVLLELFPTDSRDVQASIWTVDPLCPGFAYCMVDYRFNIQAHSKSGAPFNFWPYELKFDIMQPELIYRSLITSDDKIKTELFPGRNASRPHPVKRLADYNRSLNLTKDVALDLAKALGFSVNSSKKKAEILTDIQAQLDRAGVPNAVLADLLATALYYGKIEPHFGKLPAQIAKKMPAPVTSL